MGTSGCPKNALVLIFLINLRNEKDQFEKFRE